MNYQRYASKSALLEDKRYVSGLIGIVEHSVGRNGKKLTKKKKADLVWAFKKYENLIDQIVSGQGLRLYELNMPGGLGGSVGNIEQFMTKLEPLE